MYQFLLKQLKTFSDIIETCYGCYDDNYYHLLDDLISHAYNYDLITYSQCEYLLKKLCALTDRAVTLYARTFTTI